MNILSGCIAIVFAFSPFELFVTLTGWQCACIAIACAALFDFLDGFMARLLGAYSDLGKQLDSLSDLVSFGVAPAMILRGMLAAMAAPAWLCWATLLIPVCAALRLAKFNIDTRQTTSFIGMPVPANAIFWIGFAALLAAAPEAQAAALAAGAAPVPSEALAGAALWASSPTCVIILILLMAWLMVSPIPMFSLKFKSYGWKHNELRWTLLAAALILLAIFRLPALSLIILLYIALSSLFKTENRK